MKYENLKLNEFADFIRSQSDPQNQDEALKKRQVLVLRQEVKWFKTALDWSKNERALWVERNVSPSAIKKSGIDKFIEILENLMPPDKKPKLINLSYSDVKQLAPLIPKLEQWRAEKKTNASKANLELAQQKKMSDPAMLSEIGRLGGEKGGKARSEVLSKSQRSKIARKAAKERWQ